MKELYPLKFKTIFKEKIWGGTKIKTVLGKDYGALKNCGETWEISGVKGNVSVVSNGSLQGTTLQEILTTYGPKLVGKKSYEKSPDEFPLLVKYIDANDNLSIQVHPDDELAGRRHNSLGKTEMWYVIQADEGSELISGFNREMDSHTYQDLLKEGRLTEVLNRESAQPDDVFFLPAGRVHTIGKGLMIAEIQETSDITYRIYDFDRVDDHGKKRDLHVQEALEAIDYKFYNDYKTTYDKGVNKRASLVTSHYFTTNRLYYDESVTLDYSELDSFVIYLILEGSGTISYNDEPMQVRLGDCLLIPATINYLKILPEGGIKILESYIP